MISEDRKDQLDAKVEEAIKAAQSIRGGNAVLNSIACNDEEREYIAQRLSEKGLPYCSFPEHDVQSGLCGVSFIRN